MSEIRDLQELRQNRKVYFKGALEACGEDTAKLFELMIEQKRYYELVDQIRCETPALPVENK